MKYTDTDIVFQEVPDETTLAINISNCPCHCPGCHSAYLAEDIGTELTWEELKRLIERNKGITCVSFMGGDADPAYVSYLASKVRGITGLKTAWYSGRSEISSEIDVCNFDYIKIGPYIEELGPLKSKTTNQILYKVHAPQLNCYHCVETEINRLEDITYKLQDK